MMNRANWVAVVLFLITGCKTPDKYVPREAGVSDEDAGVTIPDAAPSKVDGTVPVPDTSGAEAPGADASSGDTAMLVDMAPTSGDVSTPDTRLPDAPPDSAPPDTASPPCTNGTARCSASATAVEICSNGQWTTQQTCPLTCANAACTAVCMAGVPCTEGIGPCRKGATTCVTGNPMCVDSGADDSRNTCGGGNVCKNGVCVAPCQAGVACTEKIGPCRKGATVCATPTSTPECNDAGADDSRNTCGGGQICKNGACAANPCQGPSAGNLVTNAGFDNSIWPAFPNAPFGPGNWSSTDSNGCSTSGSLQVGSNDSARICVSFGNAPTLYAGYMVNRSTPDGQLGCFIDTWYTDTACQDAWDLGNEDGLMAPNQTGWRQVSTTMTPPATTRSMMLACHHSSGTPAPFLLDRFYVRTSTGGF